MAAEWSYDKLEGGEEEDENDDDEGITQWGTKDGLIFLIDCSKAMFVKDQDEDSAFELCIKCAKTTIQNKIISSDKDLMSIVLYATRRSTTDEFKHIFVLHDLGLPGAEKVLQLEKLLDADNFELFEKEYGHSDNYSLADALWTCANLFSTCAQKLGFKRILLFTNNDNPHPDNNQLIRNVSTKVDDLRQNNIDLELMHINKPEKPFDLELFYKDLLYADDDEQTLPHDASEKFDELLNRVRAKNHKKRALTRLPLTLGEGLNLSVGVYNLVHSCAKPPAVKLSKKNNEEVKTVTKTFLKDSGEILMPQDLKKCQVYAAKKICFEPEEVAQMKSFDKPGLVLMGFKPKAAIKPYFHVKPAQFIYPDEASTGGSTTLFTALLTKCLEKNVVAICRYIPRKNSVPSFAALWPQEEELDDKKVQLAPPGFHLITLPFADDFRKLKLDDDLGRAQPVQIDKAKELIKKLQFAFHSESFENPALQQHYANVEAMALDRDKPDDINDFTMPDEEKIEKRAGKIAQEFKELVYPDGYQAGGAKGAARKAPVKSTVKTEDLCGGVNLEKEARAGRLGKLTVPVLKECAKKYKIHLISSKKADIIDEISEHFGV